MPLTVYEVRNNSLKEMYVGISELPFSELAKKHLFKNLRPAPLRHWDYQRQRIVYGEIQHGMPDEDARTFFAMYQKMAEVPEWTTLKDEVPG